jgi:hypothetical protein
MGKTQMILFDPKREVVVKVGKCSIMRGFTT